jgi:hypothetical protein
VRIGDDRATLIRGDPFEDDDAPGKHRHGYRPGTLKRRKPSGRTP